MSHFLFNKLQTHPTSRPGAATAPKFFNLHHFQFRSYLGKPMKWTHWGLNPGPSACKADVIPLHHVPHASFLLQGHIIAASLRNVGYLWHNQW